MNYLRCFLSFVIILLAAANISAQEKFTLKGYIKDSLSGETLIGASILIKDESRGVTTNQYGFFSLTLPKGNYELVFSYVGYLARIIHVDFNGNFSKDVLLAPLSSMIKDV